MRLHLGVIDVPYSAPAPPPPRAKKGGRRKKSPPPPVVNGTQSTGDVATFLEAKYHVMEVFSELHEEDIAKGLENSIAGALENMLMGAPAGAHPFAAGEAVIEQAFRTFLDTKEMDGTATPGVPTRASLRGVNHRLKIKRGALRPSFIDTGLYESSFKAWVD